VEATEQKYRKLYEQAENPFTKFAHEVRAMYLCQSVLVFFTAHTSFSIHRTSHLYLSFEFSRRNSRQSSHLSRISLCISFLSSQQKAQSIKSMSAADRLTLSASSFVLGRKPLRWALMAYALLLHALVFSALFFHTNAKCNATGAGAGAGSGFSAGAGSGSGSALSTSVAAAAGEGVKAIATRAAAAVLRRG
jgi:hypothetical protein